MFKKMFELLTTKGKINLAVSSLFFAIYGLSSIGMLITVFLILFKIQNGATVKNLYYYFYFLVGLLLCKGASNVIADFGKHNAGFDIVQQIREKLILKLKLFSLGFYTNERLGEINTILHKDVDNMSLVVGHMFSRMFGDFLIALVVFIGLCILNLKLSLVMFISVPIALTFLALSIKKAKSVENKNNTALLNMVSLFVEYVRGIAIIKSFSNNSAITKELESKIEDFGNTSKQASKLKAKQLAVFGFLLDAGYFLLVLYGGLSVINGNVNIFTFIIFAVVSKEFYKPFASMEMHYMYYVSGSESYKRLGKFLHADIIYDNKNGTVPQKNNIKFNNVKFYYQPDEFKIENLNFEIKENTMVAFVGESGSGKTTITNLLLRFYEVNSGSITLGDINIKEIPYDDLLDKISIVMQNVQLFNDTIYENIKVGKKNAGKEEIIEACKKAKIHDFITSLPEGYDTQIGENGNLLSGGQRQRISIARAFLKNAPILILDEMTSNVDPVNEALIQDAITELTKNRTVIVIAHHLKTIKSATQILVFKNGVLCERGTHDELLQQKNYYHTLWNTQQKSII